MSSPAPDVAAVRRFNRFYTQLIGALDEGHLASDFGLAEVRVLYELAQEAGVTATDVGRRLRLDAGYLSRILRRLEEQGLVRRQPSESDGRQHVLRLTPAGAASFAALDVSAHEDVERLLRPLTPDRRERVVGAMRTIEDALGAGPRVSTPILLRSHRPGDMGWIIHRQAVLYHRELGWDERYEALISRILADFIEHHDPERERSWIADRGGEIVGCVFLVKHPEQPGVAKLRMLYVEPSARGAGLGRRLVGEVTRFAREVGYHTLTLWTNSVLVSARRIYEAEGYRLVSEEAHDSFGQKLVGQYWELELGEADASME